MAFKSPIREVVGKISVTEENHFFNILSGLFLTFSGIYVLLIAFIPNHLFITITVPAVFTCHLIKHCRNTDGERTIEKQFQDILGKIRVDLPIMFHINPNGWFIVKLLKSKMNHYFISADIGIHFTVDLVIFQYLQCEWETLYNFRIHQILYPTSKRLFQKIYRIIGVFQHFIKWIDPVQKSQQRFR